MADATTTQLLTLLNVSALKSSKRKRPEEPFIPAPKLNKRKAARFEAEPADGIAATTGAASDDAEATKHHIDGDLDDHTEDAVEGREDDAATGDPYEEHFGPSSAHLTPAARDAVESSSWTSSSKRLGRLGQVSQSLPEGASDAGSSKKGDSILERLRTPFTERQKTLSKELREYQDDVLSALGTHRDLYVTRSSLDAHRATREAISLHALNYITKKRRRVLKNNERIAHHTKANPSAPALEDVQDQGFTRPSVLILLPFRNSALAWIDALTTHTPSPAFQIENHARFTREFGLPEGAVDKLRSAEPGTYPRDHVETFAGNVDDNFRLGVKITRKSVKLFSEFYGCDLIVASPLGLRMSIEKEKSSDFLSSIEVMIVDQMDALTMQNWDHVQFVFSSLNQIPKESHDADFSRIKPWYLDGHAAYLRQTVMLSPYETPEIRQLYNKSLKNVAGKMRTEHTWSPLAVPEGIDQEFVRFECTNPKDELEKRFIHFTKQMLPAVLKSAVQSANTIVFVPSSFDFIRVHNYFRKNAGVSFGVLSEYSSNQDISRARQAFFSGKKSLLLMSERFHFFRRYKIRGVRNILFFAPPDHPQFYAELLGFPFFDDGVEAGDVTVRILYSKLDWFRLERIAGTADAAELVNGS